MQTIMNHQASVSPVLSSSPFRRAAAWTAVVLALALIPGCPDFFPLPVPCATSEECVDQVGQPTCVDGRCVECAEAFDCEDDDACTSDTCNADNECVHAAISCDDDDACTVDSCDATAGCAHILPECPEGEECLEGACIRICTCETNADCADDNRCTIVSCVDCRCDVTAVSCDDGDPCTTDSCDPVSGCMSSATVCDDGDPCTIDSCEAAAGCMSTALQCAEGFVCEDGDCVDFFPCASDADCDDGVSCNGIETCGSDGLCHDGVTTCGRLQACNLYTDTCVDIEIDCFLKLTYGTDSIQYCYDGGPAFDGSFEVIGGTVFQTLTTGDSLFGGPGTDSLNAQLRGGGTTTPALLDSIEVINLEVRDSKASTMDLQNATGVTTINDYNSLAALIVMGLSTRLTNVGMGNGSSNLMIQILNSGALVPLAGTSDALTLTLFGVTDAGASPVLTIEPVSAGSGYETISIVSNGSSANAIQQLTDGQGNSLATINISGAQGLTIEAALDPTVTLVDARSATGLVAFALSSPGATAYGGSGNDVIRGGPGADQIDGGAGDDTITGTAGVDTFIGGVGADVFVLDQASTLGDLLGSRNTINDFVAGTDKFRANNAGGTANVGVLTGSDAFATSAAIQEHSASGNLTVNSAARLVRIAVENVSECSTDGASVLDAMASGAGTSGTITTPANGVILFSVFNGASTCLYLGATGAGDSAMTQAEIVLVATLLNFNHTSWAFGDFLP